MPASFLTSLILPRSLYSRISKISTVLLVGLALLALPACRQSEESGPNFSENRGADPWVIRSVFDGEPRMLTLALGRNFWVAYSTQTGQLRRVWRDGVDWTGAVFDARHGVQPVSKGRAWWIGEASERWGLTRGGLRQRAAYQYLGHRYEDDRVVLRFRLIASDGQSVVVDESPEFIRTDSGDVALERRFSVSSVSGAMRAQLRTRPREAVSLESEGLTLEPAADPKSGASEILVELPNDQDARLVMSFASRPHLEKATTDGAASGKRPGSHPAEAAISASGCRSCHHPEKPGAGPAWAEVATRYPINEESRAWLAAKIRSGGSGRWGAVSMPPHPDLSEDELEDILDFVWEGRRVEVPEVDLSFEDGVSIVEREVSSENSGSLFGDDRPGLAVNLFRFDHVVLTYLPEIPESARPAFAGRTRQIHAVSNEDFGDFEEFFAMQIRGELDVPESGEIAFRLVSGDPARLWIDGARTIDNDGRKVPPRAVGAKLDLMAGSHPIALDYVQQDHWNGYVLSLQWKLPGQSEFEVIPESAFRHRASDLKPTAPYRTPVLDFEAAPGHGAPLAGLHPALELEGVAPRGFEPRVGGLDFYGEDELYVSTWDADGSVYRVTVGETPTVERIAYGLAEPLGLHVMEDGEIYVLQKQELTHLIDHDGDRLIDEYEAVAQSWPVSTNYHEFAFGLLERDGRLVGAFGNAVNTGGNAPATQLPDRGTVVEFDPSSGALEFVASGLRTPNGLGFGTDGELYVADNQGAWLATSKIVHVERGDWFGYPDPPSLDTLEKPPVVWMPHEEISLSPSQPIALDVAPYRNQLLVGDVAHGGLKRIAVEEIDGVRQGAVFRFSQGFAAGVNRMVWGKQGWLYVGGVGSTGTWGQAGKEWFGLERVRFDGGSAFEMLTLRAVPTGFEIEWTEPVAKSREIEPKDFHLEQFRYESDENYGGPKRNLERLKASALRFSPDRRKATLEIPGLQAGRVIYLRLDPEVFVSETGRKLWTTEAWYTLNVRPEDESSLIEGVEEAL
jgi:cytochrome c